MAKILYNSKMLNPDDSEIGKFHKKKLNNKSNEQINDEIFQFLKKLVGQITHSKETSFMDKDKNIIARTDCDDPDKVIYLKIKAFIPLD
uniref:Uncharacterized protein n=1 Tax=Rhizophagus irregularis (strain DAOM 181602 / DAOM 197198 / MUCL 43194) TaxID=747089 RepID=U9T816_RHIID